MKRKAHGAPRPERIKRQALLRIADAASAPLIPATKTQRLHN